MVADRPANMLEPGRKTPSRENQTATRAGSWLNLTLQFVSSTTKEVLEKNANANACPSLALGLPFRLFCLDFFKAPPAARLASIGRKQFFPMTFFRTAGFFHDAPSTKVRQAITVVTRRPSRTTARIAGQKCCSKFFPSTRSVGLIQCPPFQGPETLSRRGIPKDPFLGHSFWS